jgi:hypothetical protein
MGFPRELRHYECPSPTFLRFSPQGRVGCHYPANQKVFANGKFHSSLFPLAALDKCKPGEHFALFCFLRGVHVRSFSSLFRTNLVWTVPMIGLCTSIPGADVRQHSCTCRSSSNGLPHEAALYAVGRSCFIAFSERGKTSILAYRIRAKETSLNLT